MGNNTPAENLRDALKSTCELVGATWTYTEGTFSQSKFWNRGADMTKGDYIAYFNSDVIFYQNWFENLVACWESDPQFWTVAPYSLDFRNYPCVSHTPDPVPRIVQTHNPAGGGIVFRRKDNFRWDERFPFWEMDADITYMLDRSEGKLKGGVCYASRVDHFCRGCVSQIDSEKHFGPEADYGLVTQSLKRKWNL
jgi:glycosyltransferase involved in cell wall biosynthesis